VAALATTSGGQTGTTGAALANPIVVTATDTHGNPVPNATIAFAVTAGGGSVAPASATTNAGGQAQTVWTLGSTIGAQTMTAATGSISLTVSATGQAAPSTAFTATQVSVGNRAFNCARRSTGVVWCWGENGAGQLGDGSTTFRAQPVNVAVSGVSFASVALGAQHGCALSTAGTAYCWGENGTGAVGDGTTTDRHTPVAIAGHAFASLALGENYSCGLKADGSVWCWGTRTGGTEQRLAPTRLADGGRTVVALAVSQTQVCGAVSGGGTICWTGDVFGAAAPTLENGTVTFTALVAGARHQCGLTADGRAYCWGENPWGQVGDGSTNTTRTVATEVMGGLRFTTIDAGGQHTCGVATDGTTRCWGYNLYGQIGVDLPPSTLIAAASPATVVTPAGVTFKAVSAGAYASCAIATNDAVYCWGGRAFDNNGTALVAELKPVAIQQ
jgi:alpha-tubulin suppressor-like RCC1 family protein